jgi:hypothetical protein
MRRLLIKLALFAGLIEGLSRIDLLVLLSGIAVAMAVILCTDRILSAE